MLRLRPIALALITLFAPPGFAPGSLAQSTTGGPSVQLQPRLKSGAADTAAIRGVLDMQVAAWNRGDLEGYMAGYWKSERLTFFGGGSVTRGWDATLTRYRRKYQSAGKASMGKLDFSGVEIEPLGPHSALARGRWHLAMSGDKTPDGKQLGGLTTLILRRLPEGWRIVHDHSCSD
ncbi:MAG: nuclear transport factor 2 family protein [Acidobacteriota bacterium]|nr:nuclear transport factor 2 family protein [Acidobacteriota bacterium]